MTENTALADSYEVIVIGGGAAGLSAGLVLGRSRRRTLVVDAGEPRNAPAAHMQGYLSRDGMSPAEFLATGREEIARYGVKLVRDRAVDVTRDDGFTVTLAGGRTVRARQLVVATGLKDELPPVEGLAERFGRDVLHCPYCHGWEVRDQAFGVLATSPMSVHQALIVTQWSKDVTLFLHTVTEAELSAEDLRRPRRPVSGWCPARWPGWSWRTTGSPGSGWGTGACTPARRCSSRPGRCRGPTCWHGWAPR